VRTGEIESNKLAQRRGVRDGDARGGEISGPEIYDREDIVFRYTFPFPRP